MDLAIIQQEITYRTSRSGGAGGQHVNKVETKVEAILDLHKSLAFDEAERVILLEKLANQISKEGLFGVYHQTERSQLANKELAFKKLIALIEKALKPVVIRKKKPTPKSVIIARRVNKEFHSDKKAARRKVDFEQNNDTFSK